MNTDPMGGTGGTNAFNGVTQWIDNAGLTGDIVVTMVGTNLNGAPELGDIAFCLLAGAPTSLSVGWYTTSPLYLNGIRRTGGHCVSVTRLPNFCAANRQLSIRDPGNSIGSGNTSQAAGTTETYFIQTVNVTRVDSMGTVVYAGPMERVVNYGTLGTIDGYRAYLPINGIAACNNPVNGSCVQQFIPNPTFTAQPRTTHLDFPPTATIRDLDIAADNLGAWAVGTTNGSDFAMWRSRFGSSTAALQSFPALAPFAPTRICTGRELTDVFAISPPTNIILKLNTRTGVVTPMSVADAATAICFDHDRNELVVFSSAARRVTRLNPATGAPLTSRTLPSAVALGAEPRITICPKGSYIWLTSGVNTGYGLTNATATTLAVAATISATPAQPLRGIDADNRGHVFTTAGGATLEFAEPVPPVLGGPWSLVAGGKFAGMADGPIFRIARHRNNYDRAIHDSPEETLNVFPSQFGTSVVDCPPDFNANGTLEVQDIFDFLNAWFAGYADADFDGANGLQVADIFAFLNAWFAGCQ
jgi:hypothetical protein